MPTDSFWRKRARPIVAAALAATKGQSDKEIRAALFEVYPFGERRYHPYKIWLDEIKRQRGRVAGDPRQVGFLFAAKDPRGPGVVGSHWIKPSAAALAPPRSVVTSGEPPSCE